VAGNGGGASGGGGGGSCDVADDTAVLPRLVVTLTNSTPNNLFFGIPVGSAACTPFPLPISLIDEGGKEYALWQDPCELTCEQLMTGDACPAGCPVATVTKIAQGGSWQVATPAYYYESTVMPASCAPGQGTGGDIFCSRRRPVPDGTYTVRARASGGQAYCLSGVSYCDCDKNQEGNCEIANATVDAPTIVTDAVVEISGGGRADLVFD